MNLRVAVLTILYAEFPQRTYSSLASDFPEQWLEIELGMTLREVYALADGSEPPTEAGLKPLHRWVEKDNGVEMHLDVWCENPKDHYTKVTGIGRWKRFLGVETEETAYSSLLTTPQLDSED